MGISKTKQPFERRGIAGLLPAALAGLAFFAGGGAFAAVKCQLRLGQGCNGPVVYEIQLCAQVTFEQGQCRSLCEGTRPICKVSDYDAWIAAYDKKGRHGFHGELAETGAPDRFDQTGQLAATSGKSYTVCMSEKTVSATLIGNVFNAHWSNPRPASPTVACPGVKVATADSCGAGTVFNGDPLDPRCVTQDSYCAGGGSIGNFVSTMSAGYQMVAVQNQHFTLSPEQDGTFHQSAATAGTDLPGLIAPVAGSSGAAAQAGSYASANPTRRGSAFGSGTLGVGVAGAGAGIGSDGAANRQAVIGAETSAFASKDFALEGSGYGKGTGGGNDAGGASAFGANASATAGGASGELGFGDEGGASRGLAADGRLLVEDPEDYFLRGDVAVSLFKRVTAQCRKKERSLVLAP